MNITKLQNAATALATGVLLFAFGKAAHELSPPAPLSKEQLLTEMQNIANPDYVETRSAEELYDTGVISSENYTILKDSEATLKQERIGMESWLNTYESIFKQLPVLEGATDAELRNQMEAIIDNAPVPSGLK